MATNGYRQNYRQGPPPQQQRYDDRYGQRGYENGHQGQMYNERNQVYNEQNSGAYDDNQYDQRRQLDNSYLPEAQHPEEYMERPQHNPGSQPQRPYQYDDRYHMNGTATRQPFRGAQGYPARTGGGTSLPPSNSTQHGRIEDRDYSHGNRGIKPTKGSERILQRQPDSPKTASWDNPFPAFPTKKKQTDSKSADIEDQQQPDSPSFAQSREDDRPSTSYTGQPRREPQKVEAPRPLTSHSQRNVGPMRSFQDAPLMPLQGDHQGPRHQTSFYNQQPATNSIQTRPGPRRAMTGPEPDKHLGDLGQSERRHYQDIDSETYLEHAPQQYPPQETLPSPHLLGQPNDYDQHSYPHQSPLEDNYPYTSQPQHNQSGHRGFSDNAVGHHRQPSDPSYWRDQSTNTQAYDSANYRGVPLTKKVSPEVPNFDVAPENTSAKNRDYGGPSQQQSQPLVYRKPTYHNINIPPPGTQQQQQQSPLGGNDLASPLAQFSFDLDSGGPSTQARQPVKGSIYPDYQSNPMEQQVQRKPPHFGPDRSLQYPQRDANRPQDFSPNKPHLNASNRPPPFRPGLAQPSIPNPNPNSNPVYARGLQSYDRGQPTYGSEYERNDNLDNLDRPGMPPSQMSYHSDTARQGYDQRIRTQTGFSPYSVPARPATANSARPGPMPDHGPRISSDSYQRSGMQNPDSLPAHPAPFRPGLMQPAPPAPRPTPPPQHQPQPPPPPQMHQRAPSGARPPVESEPPVTIRELNMLRDDYKNNQNDYALGLRFAKRLVEAAKVLASENGRADAKQTAKNRERYILDAHKIVKRLCGSGYPEAMFYLADCYGQGLLGLATDSKEAFSLYQSAAKLGHPQAAYRVAVCCELGAEEGGGTRRDPLKAVQWYKRAASLGDAPAMYKMGMIQLKGLLSQPKSPREAISWLKRAAERADIENPHALHELGLLYENAQSTDIILKDEKYALQLFQQAADLGYKYSQFRLGSAYEYGSLGLPIDPRMSIAWYSRAAKQGEHQSEFALSGWYLTGSGQPHPGEPPLLQQSDTEAYLWARKAASAGLAKAEYAMGYYTEVGIGVASNIDEAKTWYYRAAAQNHLKARERLEDLKKGGQRMQKTRVSRSNVGKHNEGECTVM